MKRTTIIFCLLSIFMLLITSCQQERYEGPAPKKEFAVSAYFLFDDGTLVPTTPLTRYNPKPDKMAHNAWKVSGLGSYDYNEALRLAIRRVPGATGPKFNVSNDYEVEYVYFVYNSGYSGLPKTVMDAKNWAKGPNFERLFSGTLGNRVAGDIKMIVKITKADPGVDIGIE